MTGDEQRWNALRAVLAARRADPPLSPASDLPAPVAPASFAQERLWFLDRLQPRSTAYNLAVACRLTGVLDVQALGRALAEVMERHQVLRSTLRAKGRAVEACVAAPPAPALAAETVAPDQLARWTRSGADEPFALDRGPLCRTRLARLDESDHVLLLVVHHAVFDAWSFEIFMSELCALYGPYCQGQPSPLDPLPLQYADFAAWQRRALSGEAQRASIDYWTAKLGGERPPPPLSLPVNGPSPPPGSVRRGDSQTTTLPRQLADALMRLGREEGATLHTVLLAAFKTLLHRMTGETDLVVGAPIATRSRAELTRLIGLFVNTVALRTTLDGDPTFRQVLGRVLDTVNGASAHQDVPFELVVKSLRRSGAPLFRVMFAFQNVPRSRWTWPGLVATAWNLEPRNAKCDLTFTMQLQADGLRAVLEYDADQFAAPAIARMLDQLATLLAAIIEDPDRSISRLRLLAASERKSLLSAAASAEMRPIPREATLPLLFEARVAKTPTATAVVSDSEIVTYDELNRRANRLARRLTRLRLGPEALVGVALERSVALIVAQLAILKAGAAYVPVDASAPAHHVARTLGRAAAIVTDGSRDDGLAETRAPRIRVDQSGLADEDDDGDESAARNLDLTLSCDDLAYVMFTSGSTGAPRGARIPHRGIVRLVHDASYARLAADEIFLQLAPAAFDAATFEIWGALLNGATLVLAPDRRLSIAEVVALIARHRITTLWLTAGVFELFVDSEPMHLDSLHQLVTGGDVMSPSHAARFRAQYPNCRLINGYGPTENTTFTCTHLVGVVDPDRPVPIGRPIANTVVHVLNAELEPVPVGIVGEAYLGGDGLARGYLDDPEATRERFIPNPFEPSATLYRTGDRMRRRADGALEFVGRADDQLKIRGYRVEPAEIERRLRAYPGVRQARVLPDAHTAQETRLVAYVVAEPPAAGWPDRLRAALAIELPAYMLPSAFVMLPELPLMANGKIDRRALPPAPVAGTLPRRPERLAPRDAVEHRLAGIFESVLRVSDVGVCDRLVDLGGDSLSVMALGVEIGRVFGAELPLAVLFERPTVAQLAELLRDRAARSGAERSHDDGASTVSMPNMVLIKSGRPGGRHGDHAAAGATRPLFLVAGGRGGKVELALYAKLVSRLDAAETVHGLVAPAGAETVEAIAADHLASIRRVQPRGPYRIGGECVGGVVAFEIAQQLRAAGEAVSLLLLLDAWCPTTAGVLHHNLLGQPRALLKAGLSFLATLPERDHQAEPWLAELWRRATVPPEARRYIRACMRYRPRAYAGRVTLLASDDNLRRGLARDWAVLAQGGLAIHSAPGDHETYSRRYLPETAERLRICLERHVDEGGHS